MCIFVEAICFMCSSVFLLSSKLFEHSTIFIFVFKINAYIDC